MFFVNNGSTRIEIVCCQYNLRYITQLIMLYITCVWIRHYLFHHRLAGRSYLTVYSGVVKCHFIALIGVDRSLYSFIYIVTIHEKVTNPKHMWMLGYKKVKFDWYVFEILKLMNILSTCIIIDKREQYYVQFDFQSKYTRGGWKERPRQVMAPPVSI